jgi:hypothetical protein
MTPRTRSLREHLSEATSANDIMTPIVKLTKSFPFSELSHQVLILLIVPFSASIPSSPRNQLRLKALFGVVRF